MKSQNETAPPSRPQIFNNVIALAVVVAAAGCDRDLLIGAVPRNDPAGSSGGNGVRGGGTGGVAGTGGPTDDGGATAVVPDNTCESLVTTPGDPSNPCGGARGALTVAYSPDGQTLAVARDGAAPNLHLWRLSDGVLLRSMGTSPGRLDVAYSPDGRMLAVAGWGIGDGPAASFHTDTVSVWDPSTGALIQNVPAHCGDAASAVAFSHDGSLLATAGTVGPIEVWRTTDWKRMATLPFSQTAYSVRFSPDGSRVLATGSNSKAAVLDIATETVAFTFSQGMPVGGATPVADFSPSGKLIVSQGRQGTLDIRRAAEGTLTQSLPGVVGNLSGVAWIDDDHLVTVVAGPADADTVTLWTASSGTFSGQKTWSFIRQLSGNVSISPGRSQIAVGGYNIAFLAL